MHVGEGMKLASTTSWPLQIRHTRSATRIFDPACMTPSFAAISHSSATWSRNLRGSPHRLRRFLKCTRPRIKFVISGAWRSRLPRVTTGKTSWSTPLSGCVS